MCVCVPRANGIGARRLLSTTADFAVQARVGKPLDADIVTNLAVRRRARADSHNRPDTLVSTYQWQTSIEGPVTLESVQVWRNIRRG